MIPSHGVEVRRGNGWTIVDTSGIQQSPGVHDIGARLGIPAGTIVLVILRAAERWVPEREIVSEPTAIVCGEGRLLVELTDDSALLLEAEREWSTAAGRSLEGVINIGCGLAKALVIAQPR